MRNLRNVAEYEITKKKARAFIYTNNNHLESVEGFDPAIIPMGKHSFFLLILPLSHNGNWEQAGQKCLRTTWKNMQKLLEENFPAASETQGSMNTWRRTECSCIANKQALHPVPSYQVTSGLLCHKAS